jgi:hypothetical protein
VARFKLKAEPLRVMIHDDLQRVIRGEMLEQTKKDGVTSMSATLITRSLQLASGMA